MTAWLVLLGIFYVGQPADAPVAREGNDRSRAQESLPSCGVACCFVLLRLHGLPVTLPEVKNQFASETEDFENLSAAELVRALKGLGLESTGWKCELERPSTWPTPAILHFPPEKVRAIGPRNGHFVVLVAVRGEVADVVDASMGVRRTVPVSDLARMWPGNMIVAREVLSGDKRGIEKILAGALVIQAAIVVALVMRGGGCAPIREQPVRGASNES